MPFITLIAIIILLWTPYLTNAQPLFTDKSSFAVKPNYYFPAEIPAIRAENNRIKGINDIPDGARETVLVPAKRHQIRIRFEGESRPLSDDSRRFIRHAATSFPFIPSQQWSFYTEEILVSAEGGKCFLGAYSECCYKNPDPSFKERGCFYSVCFLDGRG